MLIAVTSTGSAQVFVSAQKTIAKHDNRVYLVLST